MTRSVNLLFMFNAVVIVALAMMMMMMIDTLQAQCTPNSTTLTHPDEARALSAIFSLWNIQSASQWNTSGNLCTGVAVDATDIQNINPGIKCDCSYSGSTICHITALKVLDVSGQLPQELWNLTYLTHLYLGSNSFYGSIPPSIRYLTRLQHLNLSINLLSGELPAELGLLTDLRSLSVRVNNFSGSLPSSLGNLSRLTEIYMDSSGVSGPIPSTFANLRSLETVWASDNELSGQIPTFIGNWRNLTALRFQGNSFQGPIPTSFIGLVSLNELRISDLSDGSSSLDFLVNMNNLSTLVLRNNNISGGIPSFFSQFDNLFLLDLSFNQLSGSLPDFLFQMSSLTYMFLGNNMLTGRLPTEKSAELLIIDLSYNELHGSFPTWIRDPQWHVNFTNLVANNFDVEDSNDRLLLGLHCLQRNFSCNRGSPIYSSFAINCGDNQQSRYSTNQVEYENDFSPLGPAGHYVTGSRRWAVSNAGLPSDTSNPQYQAVSNIPANRDVELFTFARISAGSLRYYGLGLENGNYTVTLHFPATEFMSRGRRIFNIYIQGSLQVRDFLIRRQAYGAFASTITRNFTAQVTDNYLEIHLFWAGKGSNLPENGTYGPLISAISATPDFTPTVRNRPPSRIRNQTLLISGIVVAIGATCMFLVAALYYVYYGRKRQENFGEEELREMDTQTYRYSYPELKKATNDFNLANKLGEGGFGPVYKGTLRDGRRVAIKRLSVASNHGKSQFVAEIATISAVQHRNLVKLYGCCVEGGKPLLVYEYLENKSLDQLLFGTANKCFSLSLPKRYDICLGVARGLAYLHEESRPRIVHRDVKASNILLDSDLAPKISDFGLAKLYDDQRSHISTRVAGTIGYLAPEYAMRGHLTEKADIFSFGVVALEIISGRPNSDISLEEDKIYLLEWAWNLHESNRLIELVDHNLNRFDEDVVKRVIGTGLLCTQTSPNLRPSMSRVVAMLCGDIEVPAATSKPSYLTDLNFADATTFARYTDSTLSGTDINVCSSSTAMVTNQQFSPVSPTRPMLHEKVVSSTDDNS